MGSLNVLHLPFASVQVRIPCAGLLHRTTMQDNTMNVDLLQRRSQVVARGTRAADF